MGRGRGGAGLRAAAAAVAVAAGVAGLAACSPEEEPAVPPTVSSSTAAPPGSTAPTAPTTPSSAPPPTATPAVRTGVPWHLDRLDQRTGPLDGRFTAATDGTGVRVYVLDTGLDLKHAEFGGRAVLGADFVGDPDAGDCYDGGGLGHGTFVAGVIAGRTHGVAPGAELVRVQAIACEEGSGPGARRDAGPPAGPTAEAAVIRAVEWVAAHARRPAVVNMSLNLAERSAALDAAVERLIASGIPVVVSAGNFADDACAHSPAGARGAIVVAASTRDDRHWTDGGSHGSGHGSCVDLYAPGAEITSALAGAGTATADAAATSWAAPHATGAAALHLAAHPTATPAEVRAALLGRAVRGALGGVPAGTPNRLLHTKGL
ncbi:S8 family peptidase [Streptomyces globosus]|uniref:S8 family peptidase n=1 Tax=Streptomyces globosus TaxID=68209 RepID=UPI0037F99075